jgi:DNA polymerase elongation subunit (family B)
MYRNVYYDQRNECVKLFTWDEDGKRITAETSYNPFLYVETKLKGTGTSLFNTPVKRRTFTNQYERRKFLSNSGITRVFENVNCDHQFLIEQFWQEHDKPEFTQHPLKIHYLDIETYSPGDFPHPESAKDAINVITIYDSIDKKFYTWGTKKLKKSIDNCDYVYCSTEALMLERFLLHLEKDHPDVITGWNSEFFDIPYLVNRISKVLGEHNAERLSPVGNLFQRTMMGQFGKEQTRWYINGVACLDFLDVYKKFSVGLRESYKLDSIAELELGEKKVDYGNTNLSSLADDDWQTFVEYNVQDVNLLVKMEDKLRYLGLLRMLAYVGLTPLESAMGTLSLITGAIIIKGHEKGLVIPTFVKDPSTAGKYEGAYVGEPQRGFQEDVVSFDANSLYPNTMITLNLSPETKVGTIVDKTDTHVTIRHVSGKIFTLTHEKFLDFINKEDISVSKAKVLFSQAKKGIVPEIVDKIYQDRVEIKKEHKKLKKKLTRTKKESRQYNDINSDINRLDIKQFTLKILINTVYGYFGNKHAPVGDPDIARSITLTGQAVIKKSNDILKKYIHQRTGDESVNPIVYNDTDSSYITIKALMDSIGVPFSIDSKVTPEAYKAAEDIEDHLNTEITKWSQTVLNSKDSRFVFKRECMCDVGIFLQKKRYVLHILDDEGFEVNKFKYTGVEVVRSTMPKTIKPYVKKIIETMLSTKNHSRVNEVFLEAYNTFKSLPVENFAFAMGISNYDKYADRCDGFSAVKGMPIHVKASYYHNTLLKKHKIDQEYEMIGSGDKVRYFYVNQPNKYGISAIAYKYYLPDEFKDVFKPDVELMFEKIVYSVIERFYDAVNWRLSRPGKQVQTDLFDLLAV